MLDQAQAEDRSRIGWRDRADLIRGALDARFAFWDPRGRIAEVAVGLGLGMGLVYLAVSIDPGHAEGAGAFANPTYVAVTFWIAAYIASLAHRPAITRWMCGLALLVHTAIGLALWLLPVAWLGPSLYVTLPFLVLGLAACAREVRRREAVTTAVALPALVIAAVSALVQLLTA
jgi:hypothetical protein